MSQKNISCPNCAKQFSVLENLGGQKTECIFCKHKLTIPNFNEDIILPDDGSSKRYYTNLILTIFFIIVYAASISLKGATVLLVITIIFLFALKKPTLISSAIGFVLFGLDVFWLFLWNFTEWNLLSDISGVGIGIILIFGIISGGILLFRS